MVERGGLENRYTFTGIGGSNPPLSANRPYEFMVLIQAMIDRYFQI